VARRSCTGAVDVSGDDSAGRAVGGAVGGARDGAADRWTVDGVVVPGERRGRQLGWPTANVDVDGGALPPDGVYAGLVTVAGLDGGPFPAAVSVGSNPTFAGTSRTVEAYLLDFDGDLYGRRVRVEARARLRDTMAFGSVVDLLVAVEDDVARTRALLTAP
jgi:riboflavin kinase/FMN adenylyltransferase